MAVFVDELLVVVELLFVVELFVLLELFVDVDAADVFVVVFMFVEGSVLTLLLLFCVVSVCTDCVEFWFCIVLIWFIVLFSTVFSFSLSSLLAIVLFICETVEVVLFIFWLLIVLVMLVFSFVGILY